MQSRKDEILAKRAKLAELRRQKELRQQEFSANRRSIGSSKDLSPQPARTEDREELDKLISKLVDDDKGSPSSKDGGTPSTPGRGRSRPSSYQSTAQDGECNDASSPKHATAPATSSATAPQSLSFAPLSVIYEIQSETPKSEYITYNKGVQTSTPWAQERSPTASDDEDDGALSSSPRSQRRRLSRRQKEREEELRENIRNEIIEELRAIQEPHENGAVDGAVQKQNFPARALSDEELDAVTSSNDFLDFVDRSTKVIERALDEEYDVLADYRHGGMLDDDDEDESGATGPKGRRVKQQIQFYDERWSKKRMISDIGFSPKFPELLLSSYTKNPAAPYDPDGLIMVWNQHMHDRPEYVFQATSDILTAKFSPFHPNLIIAGAYSGQVLLFDTRSRSPYPVQKTPLTGSGHTHPVYSLNVVGTQNAHNILSTSTDGVVCSWSIDMLSTPQEFLELTAPPPTSQPAAGSSALSSTAAATTPYHRPTEDIAPTTTAFPPSDPTYFLAGTEEGSIHLAHRYDRAGAKAGIDARIAYRGHAAPVTSLDFHKASGPVDLSDLLLSASLDWSIKVWRVRTHAQAAATTAGGAATPPPLLDLPRDDVVYDAKWSPVKPGVFAAVDGAGSLEVWDLARDSEVPVSKVTPSPRMEAGAPVPIRSLNKCAWEVHDGKRIGVGGLDGVVTVFEVGSDLGGKEQVARKDEWAAVKRLVGRNEKENR